MTDLKLRFHELRAADHADPFGVTDLYYFWLERDDA